MTSARRGYERWVGMTGPAPAVAATRVAVRRALAGFASPDATGAPSSQQTGGLVLVACSGGADSLALAAAAAFEAPRAGLRAGAVVVDHGLQTGSGEVAREAACVCEGLGLDPVIVARAEVGAGGGVDDRAENIGVDTRTSADGELDQGNGKNADRDPGRDTASQPNADAAGGGPEALARAARYAALTEAAREHGAVAVLLGHTLDDQAEQVLLGLARGSGARSLAGMPRSRGVFVRPLLGLPASTTRQACADLGLTPWSDPHNTDERYRRVRARKLLREMEDQLGPGVVAALARSADLLRTDADALDALAEAAAGTLGEPPWRARDFAALDDAVRGRVWRLLARDAGVPMGALAHRHVAEADRLLIDYRGQDGVSWPGGHMVRRRGPTVSIEPPVD